jgi:hypothetical protein
VLTPADSMWRDGAANDDGTPDDNGNTPPAMPPIAA